MLISTDLFKDIGSLSPDNLKLIYISTTINYTTNISIKNLLNRIILNIIDSNKIVQNLMGSYSFYRLL